MICFSFSLHSDIYRDNFRELIHFHNPYVLRSDTLHPRIIKSELINLMSFNDFLPFLFILRSSKKKLE